VPSFASLTRPLSFSQMTEYLSSRHVYFFSGRVRPPLPPLSRIYSSCLTTITPFLTRILLLLLQSLLSSPFSPSCGFSLPSSIGASRPFPLSQVWTGSPDRDHGPGKGSAHPTPRVYPFPLHKLCVSNLTNQFFHLFFITVLV